MNCCNPDGFCCTLWRPTAEQRERDPHLDCTRVALIAAGVFFILSIAFCCLMMHHEKPLNVYTPLFASSFCASIVPLIARFCCFEAPIAPPESDSDAEAPPPPPPPESDSSDSEGSN